MKFKFLFIYLMLIMSLSSFTYADITSTCGNLTSNLDLSFEYFSDINEQTFIYASYDNETDYINDSVTNVTLGIEGVFYPFTYNSTTGLWHIGLSSSDEEDVDFVVNTTSLNYTCESAKGTLQFREPFDYTFQLYQVDKLNSSIEVYKNDFHYIYLKIVDDDDAVIVNSGFPTTEEMNRFYHNTMGWIPGSDYLFGEEVIDVETVLWGYYQDGSATIKLYENNSYDVYLLTQEVYMDTWDLEFYKPQQSPIKLDTRIVTELNITEESDQTVKIMTNDWEISKVNFLANIFKIIIICILIIIGLGLLTFLPGGSKLIGIIAPLLIGIGFKYMGIL